MKVKNIRWKGFQYVDIRKLAGVMSAVRQCSVLDRMQCGLCASAWLLLPVTSPTRWPNYYHDRSESCARRLTGSKTTSEASIVIWNLQCIGPMLQRAGGEQHMHRDTTIY